MQIEFTYPICGSEDAALDTVITIVFTSATDTLVVSSIVVTIDGQPALVGEDVQCGFEGALHVDGYGPPTGERILTIGPITAFSAEHTVVMAAYALDAEGAALETCAFETECSDCLADTEIVGMAGGVYEVDDDGNITLLWDSSTTPLRIISDAVNDVYLQRTNNNTYVAVATDAGVSMVKNCISSLCYGGGAVGGAEFCLSTIGEMVDGYGNLIDGYCNSYQATEVYIDELTKLYILNATSNRIEVFYEIDDDLVGRNNPEAVYSAATIPELGGVIINTMHVAEYLSAEDTGSNVLFVGNDMGMLRIDLDESAPGASETNFIVTSYGVVGSSTDYEILGGTSNNVVAITYDHETQLLAVATENPITFVGGVTIIDTRVNAQVHYYSDITDVESLSFSNLNIFQV